MINGNEGVTADAKTVTVMEMNSSEFQDGNGNGNLGEISSQEISKTAGNNFDSNGILRGVSASL